MSQISVNPATGRRVAIYREHSRAAMGRALERGAAAHAAWRKVMPERRARTLRALARELRQRRDALAALATDEMGKPITQARAEVEKCATLCDYYAAEGPGLLVAERPPGAADNARVVFEPLGTVLAIMPWNFPFWQVMRAAVPTLLAGNAVLLKHAPNVPGCALATEKLFAQAGFPPGLFQALLIATDAVPSIIRDPRVCGVTLTGSTAAGKAVAQQAGAAMKPAVFELGGSDPAIILPDADLDLAAEKTAQARLLNSGQSCICAKRFIVVRSVLKDFEQRFTARMAARRVGAPTDPATEVGPLARADLRDALHAQVTASIRRGARVLLGGQPRPGPGYFYEPTVLTHVRPGMPAADEEIFGPVGAILPVRDEAEAIAVANASRFGLGATVYTRSRRRADALARQLQAGCVFINDFVRSSPELPFGGIKESGYGRELGSWGLRAFVNTKTIVG